MVSRSRQTLDEPGDLLNLAPSATTITRPWILSCRRPFQLNVSLMQSVCPTLLAITIQLFIHSTLLMSQEISPAKDVAPTTEREVARGENYIVYAYRKTELQDYLIGKSKKSRREDYKAYVIVDGPSMVNQDGFIDPDSLDWAKIATEMRKLRVDDQSIASFHVLAGGGPSNSPALTWLLEGFGRNRCRFDHVYWRVSSSTKK